MNYSYKLPGVFLKMLDPPGSYPYADAYYNIDPISNPIPIIDFSADQKFITKNIMAGLNINSFDTLKTFIEQSIKEAEITIKCAEQKDDKDQYNWWCGFVEALNEMMAKIEEIESNE